MTQILLSIFQTILVVVQLGMLVKIIFDDRRGKQISNWRFCVTEFLAIPVTIISIVYWVAF